MSAQRSPCGASRYWLGRPRSTVSGRLTSRASLYRDGAPSRQYGAGAADQKEITVCRRALRVRGHAGADALAIHYLALGRIGEACDARKQGVAVTVRGRAVAIGQQQLQFQLRVSDRMVDGQSHVAQSWRGIDTNSDSIETTPAVRLARPASMRSGPVKCAEHMSEVGRSSGGILRRSITARCFGAIRDTAGARAVHH